jgi:hypothetical protein
MAAAAKQTPHQAMYGAKSRNMKIECRPSAV